MLICIALLVSRCIASDVLQQISSLCSQPENFAGCTDKIIDHCKGWKEKRNRDATDKNTCKAYLNSLRDFKARENAYDALHNQQCLNQKILMQFDTTELKESEIQEICQDSAKCAESALMVCRKYLNKLNTQLARKDICMSFIVYLPTDSRTYVMEKLNKFALDQGTPSRCTELDNVKSANNMGAENTSIVQMDKTTNWTGQMKSMIVYLTTFLIGKHIRNTCKKSQSDCDNRLRISCGNYLSNGDSTSKIECMLCIQNLKIVKKRKKSYKWAKHVTRLNDRVLVNVLQQFAKTIPKKKKKHRKKRFSSSDSYSD